MTTESREVRTQAELDQALTDGVFVVIRGDGHFGLYGSATVRACDSATVSACGSATVRAGKYVAVHDHGGPTITGGVVIKVPAITTAQQWCEYRGVEVVDINGRPAAVLIKAVADDFLSARSAPDGTRATRCRGRRSARPSRSAGSPGSSPAASCATGSATAPASRGCRTRAGPRRSAVPSNPLPDQSILVRVAPEILAHMKTGDVEPVVILGVQDMGDGTHDMTLMKPEIVAERDRLAGEVERLREENDELLAAQGRLTGWLTQNKAEATKAWTEVERLRDALRTDACDGIVAVWQAGFDSERRHQAETAIARIMAVLDRSPETDDSRLSEENGRG